jgi:hypothetical protein
MRLEELRRIRWHFDMGWLLKETKIRCRTFCECGVGPLSISAAPSVHEGRLAERLLLVEPNPELHRLAKEKMPNADIRQVAIGDNIGKHPLRLNGGSSHLKGTWAPTMGPDEEVLVDVVTFDLLDDGEIDCMVLDNEGQEWSVLSKMRSRPLILSVELWRGHPHLAEIEGWLSGSGYVPRLSTGPEGETILFTR